MSKLEELIQELCPDGVEYKPFFDIAKYIRGVTYNKSCEITDGSDGYKLLRANNITLANNSLNLDDIKTINFGVKVKDEQFLKKDDILICAGSGSKDHIGKVAFISEDMKYTFGGFMGVIRANIKFISPRYLYHILTSKMFKEHLYKISDANSTTINNINNNTWKKFFVPIPPLEVQKEIVHLLDEFTAKTAELQAELNKEYEARKKQYEYYRDTLLIQKSLFINNNKTTDFLYDIELICSKVNVELSKDPEIKEQQCSYYKEIIKTYNETGKIPSSLEQTKKMSIIKIIQYLYGYANVNLLDVANNYTGLTYKPSDKADYGTLVLRSSNIVNNRLAYDDNVFVQMETIPQRAIAKENDILVCVRNGSRALIGKSAIIPHTQTPMAFGAFMTVLRANPTLLNYKYLYFVWQTNYVQNLIHGDEAMPINQITNKEFKRIHFALPTLNEQNALVQKLEKLEETSFELQSNISIELESRQKQYEFYRDKLLTFNKLGTL